MKNVAIIAASFAMAQLISAAPVNNKRDTFFSITTEEVWETTWATTTVWVDPSATAAPATDVSSAAASSASDSLVGGFKHRSSSISIPSSTAAVPTTSSVAVPTSSSVAAPVAVASSSSSFVVPSPSTSAFVLPTPSPTSTFVAPVPTSTSVVATPATSSAPAVASPVATSTSSSSGTHSGDMTYYDVSVGLGSCGVSGSNSQNLVAINAIDMANGIDPNANPKCGKMININYNGETHSATIFDTCPECAEGAIDVTNTLFTAVAPDGNGRVHGVSWSFA